MDFIIPFSGNVAAKGPATFIKSNEFHQSFFGEELAFLKQFAFMNMNMWGLIIHQPSKPFLKELTVWENIP